VTTSFKTSVDSGSRAMIVRRRLKRGVVTAVVIAIYVWSARGIGFNVVDILRELPLFFSLLGRMLPPNWSFGLRILPAVIETIQIAILATAIGAVFSVPITLLAAGNVNGNRPLYLVAKAFMNLIRTIPELLYASILVAGIGLGAFAGMIALVIFSTGVIAKLTSESLEAVDTGPFEAIHAVGGNKLELIRMAVIPQILPSFSGYTLYVFEINIRASTVLGLVGAGGIGTVLRTSLDLFRYQNAATTILVTFLLVAVIDFVSTKLRERLI